MKNKIFDSEIKVMEIVWENEPITAKQVSVIAAQTIGWNKNTTYTVIKKLEAKGFIKRDEPNFVCIVACVARRSKTGRDALSYRQTFRRFEKKRCFHLSWKTRNFRKTNLRNFGK